MGKYDKVIDKLDKEAKKRDQNTAKVKCPKKRKPAIYVAVMRGDTGDPVSGIKVDISKPTKQSPSTGGDGEVKVDPAKVGTHGVKVLLTEEQKKKFADPQPASMTTANGETSVHYFLLEPLPELSVQVMEQEGTSRKAFNGARVKAGKRPELKTAGGAADFGAIPAGKYRVTVVIDRPTEFAAEAFDNSKGVSKDSFSKFGRGKTISWDAELPYGESQKYLVVLAKTPLCKLRVILVDKEDKPISGKEWELDSPIAGSGTTAANGLIELKALLLEKGNGVLKVKMGLPPPKPLAPSSTAPVTPPTNPPPYPPPIKAEDYKDKAPDPPVADGDGTVEWALTLSLPDDFKDDPSVKCRLQNLGFTCARDTEGAATIRAVKHYQRNRLKQDAPSGSLGDIKGSLTGFHDNP